MRRRWCLSGAWVGVMWIAGFGGCSAEPRDEFASGTWADLNMDKLDYDCRQVTACNEERNSQIANGYDKCMKENATNLNANPASQAVFLTKYTRCNLHMSCDYTTCVSTNPPSSYGMSQIDKLNYVCSAKANCGA